MNKEVRQNSLRAWLLAARPKTLTAALIPVAVAGAIVLKLGVRSEELGVNIQHSTFNVQHSTIILCFLFAALMQVAANFINDYFDYRKGTDRDDRLGPERACAQGWITPRAMRWGIALTLLMAAITGLAIVFKAQCSMFNVQCSMFAIGAACIVFAFLYTTVLSYSGMGDLLVLVFFGFVPCCGTALVTTGRVGGEAWLGGAVCGVLIDTLLILNNYRDRDTDRLSGKRTLIVLWGERFGRWFYLGCGVAAWLLTWGFAPQHGLWPPLLTLPYLLLHARTWREMVRIRQGRALNDILGQTSRNMLVFGLLLCLALLAG